MGLTKLPADSEKKPEAKPTITSKPRFSFGKLSKTMKVLLIIGISWAAVILLVVGYVEAANPTGNSTSLNPLATITTTQNGQTITTTSTYEVVQINYYSTVTTTLPPSTTGTTQTITVTCLATTTDNIGKPAC